MSRGQLLLLLLIGAGGAAAWWFTRAGADGSSRADPGMLAVQWRGRYRGSVTLPAKVNWCPVNRTGVLEAISGDTGVAVVIYEENALTSGPHAAVMPGVSPVLPRPGASVVMRWPRDTTALLAFSSQSGLVELRSSAKLLSGTLAVRLRAASGNDTLTLSGSFTDVPVVTMAVGCP
jgi:hypothetical protein